jgi:hypothetical protein
MRKVYRLSCNFLHSSTKQIPCLTVVTIFFIVNYFARQLYYHILWYRSNFLKYGLAIDNSQQSASRTSLQNSIHRENIVQGIDFVACVCAFFGVLIPLICKFVCL